jgi:molybdopterin-guanine dinucleotide biosynthesis protein A
MTTPDAAPAAAIVLAGGRAARVGGAAKPLFEVGDASLLTRAVAAARAAGADPVVVAGPALDPALDVTWVREDPPFGGPAAATRAALERVGEAETVLLLAGDLADAGGAIRALLAPGPLAPGVDGRCLVDRGGRRQWLVGWYRTAALRAVSLPDAGRGASLRALLSGSMIEEVPDAAHAAADIDTWDDLRARGGTPGRSRRTEDPMAQHLPPEALDDWADALRAELGIEAAESPIPAILDLARDVSNAVARPAAPLSAFMAGLAAGRAGGGEAAVRDAIAAVTRAAADWPTPQS